MTDPPRKTGTVLGHSQAQLDQQKADEDGAGGEGQSQTKVVRSAH